MEENELKELFFEEIQDWYYILKYSEEKCFYVKIPETYSHEILIGDLKYLQHLAEKTGKEIKIYERNS